MDDDQLQDLKQFITATVSQAFANVATKDDIANMATKDDIGALDKKLSSKIDDLDLKIDTISEALHSELANHEQRVAKLEQQAA